MYPRERSFVSKYGSNKFVLLGVNTDPKERLAKAIKQGTVTWDSWWDGGDTYGPIASRWNVKSWPTIYLIDKKGVIRYKGHKEDFDELLTELLKEE